ncbi:thiamine phosphate synthase [Sunxiuqinia indica]|uniref:thiamine phosphate synthase n=1 Tax=Sunxiuqinia indica TaxID=2692584 RepID=UPI0013570C41|nr:thiamine phosphate synthase [Sunxiuqinia indica]
MNPEKTIASLQLVTHPVEGNSPFNQAKLALQGGCKWIQLRMKNQELESFISEGRKIMILKEFHDFKLIINDHPKVAMKLQADGVHLGKQDMAPGEARRILGDDFIIGGTANSEDDIMRLVGEGVDYIGLGPFRFTSTKENLSPVIGLEGYQRLMDWMMQNELTIPVVGIGGIGLGDVDSLLQSGLHGLAVSSAITKAKSITSKTKLFLREIQKTQQDDKSTTFKIR